MHVKTMSAIRGSVLVTALLGMSLSQARAQFTENFNSGTATFTTNDSYWLDHSQANGFITQTTNSASIAGGSFTTNINTDASGSGYFLFNGTANTVPANNEFYISPTFAVTPNSNYLVSFALTNADTTNPASIQPEIGGQLLGSSVSAVGTYDSNGWQTFNFSWNSGSNTSVSLILHDLTPTAIGNDFGVDNISVQPAAAATPEPGTVALLVSCGFGITGAIRRKRRE